MTSGTARRCPRCGDAFVLRVKDTMTVTLCAFYVFLNHYALHLRMCSAKRTSASGLNEAGKYYMGLL